MHTTYFTTKRFKQQKKKKKKKQNPTNNIAFKLPQILSPFPSVTMFGPR